MLPSMQILFTDSSGTSKDPSSSAQQLYTFITHGSFLQRADDTTQPGSRGLDGGLSVMPEPRVGPQHLLDGHPGVPGPHRGRIDRWLHGQAGQQSQETC